MERGQRRARHTHTHISVAKKQRGQRPHTNACHGTARRGEGVCLGVGLNVTVHSHVRSRNIVANDRGPWDLRRDKQLGSLHCRFGENTGNRRLIIVVLQAYTTAARRFEPVSGGDRRREHGLQSLAERVHDQAQCGCGLGHIFATHHATKTMAVADKCKRHDETAMEG
jgi:hypothetical protein